MPHNPRDRNRAAILQWLLTNSRLESPRTANEIAEGISNSTNTISVVTVRRLLNLTDSNEKIDGIREVESPRKGDGRWAAQYYATTQSYSEDVTAKAKQYSNKSNGSNEMRIPHSESLQTKVWEVSNIPSEESKRIKTNIERELPTFDRLAFVLDHMIRELPPMKNNEDKRIVYISLGLTLAGIAIEMGEQ